MPEEISIITTKSFMTTEWSGGTTTQLYIYPSDSEYVKRDFLFRISTAQIKAFESQFTHLPGIKRKLLILDGEITIEHKDQYTKTLRIFDQDEFPGEWTTKSCGYGIDFNLMLRENLDGQLLPYSLGINETMRLKVKEGTVEIFIYLLSGTLQISVKGTKYILRHQNLFKCLNNNELNLIIDSLEESRFIVVEIIHSQTE